MQEEYHTLLKFIDYFETAADETKNDPFIKRYINGYPIYTDELNAFIDIVNRSGVMDCDYLAHLRERFGEDKWRIEDIAQADMDTLWAILTQCVRSERFGDGSWSAFARDGVFAAILRRLQELIGSDG